MFGCKGKRQCLSLIHISTQHLEETEDLTVHLLDEEEVNALLFNDEVKQSLMAAPFWKYFALYSRL